AVRTDADAGRCAFQPIEKENVFAIVGVAGDQVRGAGLEDDVAAVAADPGIVAASVARFAAGLFAEAFQRPRLAIEQKNVLLKIVVVTRQIVSSRGERDEASVGADIGRSAGVVAWTPVGGAADDLQRRRRRRARDHGADGIQRRIGPRAAGSNEPL